MKITRQKEIWRKKGSKNFVQQHIIQNTPAPLIKENMTTLEELKSDIDKIKERNARVELSICQRTSSYTRFFSFFTDHSMGKGNLDKAKEVGASTLIDSMKTLIIQAK